MKNRVRPVASSGVNCPRNSSKWAGVIFTRLKFLFRRKALLKVASPGSGVRMWTQRPTSKGANKPVMVRSNEMEELTGAPVPAATSYASAAQSR